MEWPAVLQRLHVLELTSIADEDGLMVEGDVDRIDDHLADAILEHRDTLLTILSGGHAWSPCSSCGIGLLLPVRSPGRKERPSWPACRMTPHCTGTHAPHPEQIAAMVAAGIPAPAAQRRVAARSGRRLFGSWPLYPPYPAAKADVLLEQAS
jgi:hypothetical protein